MSIDPQGPFPEVAITFSAYALGKELGPEAAMAELDRQLAKPDQESLPAVRVVARVRQWFDVALRRDTGGTVLGKVRSRHAHAAWQSGARVWLSCDDDVEATSETLRAMFAAVDDDTTPRIVVAPYAVRGEENNRRVVHVSVDLPRIVVERRLASGALLRRVKASGFGLVAVNRLALRTVREFAEAADLAYVDDDGVERLALFHDTLQDRKWLGEDLAFFANVPSSVVVEALLTGATVHDGDVLNLAELA